MIRRAGAGTKQSGARAAAVGSPILWQCAIQVHGTVVAATIGVAIGAGKGAVARVGTMTIAIAVAQGAATE